MRFSNTEFCLGEIIDLWLANENPTWLACLRLTKNLTRIDLSEVLTKRVESELSNDVQQYELVITKSY